jgi:hypothetical protein
MLVCDFGNMEFTNAQPDKIGRTPKSVQSFTLKPASTTGSPEPAWAAHKTIRTGKKPSPSQPELTIDFLPPFEVDLQHDKLEAPTLTAVAAARGSVSDRRIFIPQTDKLDRAYRKLQNGSACALVPKHVGNGTP